MNSVRWQRVERLFHEAMARPPAERAAFLMESCPGDDQLRSEVEALLGTPPTADGLFGVPALAMAARMAGESAPVLTGRRLGVYEVLEPIGAGGMGEVYRARDTRLGRDVAIKILPPAFIADPDRLARFERESRLLASFNHPNIATVHGVEERDGVRAFVMELVGGETLAERLRRGAISVSETLTIARQIADALDAAHERGIIHRDLKPANIKLTADGVVKVLDFGLAKWAAGGGGVDGTNSPTLTLGGTREGTILGTAAYMSPEQARGKPVDKRSDIWAFGCVLYEMLTARSAFGSATVTDTLAAIVDREPDWTPLPAMPPTVARLLRRCLDKEPKRRLHDIGDARIDIEDVLSGAAAGVEAAADSVPRRVRLRWPWRLAAVTAFVAIVAGAMWVGARSRPASPASETRLDIVTPPTDEPASIAISPDGRTVAFVATSEGRSELWQRALDGVSAQPVSGTDGARYPFWSPDSRSIGFFADGKLKRIDIAGGAAQVLADASAPAGGAWNRDGTILFAPIPVGPIVRVSATGGAPSALTALEPRQAGHQWPQLLPDGIHFLYVVTGSPDVRGLYVGGLDGSMPPRLLDLPAGAVYASSGDLLFVREDTLFAQPLDPVGLTLTGSPVRVADGVAVTVVAPSWSPVPAVAAADAGPIIYRRNAVGGGRQLIWFDRSGREVTRVGDPISTQGGAVFPSPSPDGRVVALSRTVDGNPDIWLLDVTRRVLSRFTFDAASEALAEWSPDGSRIVFNSNRNGVPDLFQKSVAGGGAESPLPTTPNGSATLGSFLNGWSPDGRFVIYEHVESPKTLLDLWVLPLAPAGAPFPVVQSPYEDQQGSFAPPDGTWIAYSSNESGRLEVYVRPLRSADGRRQVSTDGGMQPRWRGDGKELFYAGLDGRLMAVPISRGSNGQSVEVGRPSPLFARRGTSGYVVSPDGQRFLIETRVEVPSSPITVIQNWKGGS